jgi:hypothetical protein
LVVEYSARCGMPVVAATDATLTIAAAGDFRR